MVLRGEHPAEHDGGLARQDETEEQALPRRSTARRRARRPPSRRGRGSGGGRCSDGSRLAPARTVASQDRGDPRAERLLPGCRTRALALRGRTNEHPVRSTCCAAIRRVARQIRRRSVTRFARAKCSISGSASGAPEETDLATTTSVTEPDAVDGRRLRGQRHPSQGHRVAPRPGRPGQRPSDRPRDRASTPASRCAPSTTTSKTSRRCGAWRSIST